MEKNEQTQNHQRAVWADVKMPPVKGIRMLNQSLKNLLDFQRFTENPRLTRLIADTERRCFREKDENALDEDSLSQVSAAGDTDARLAEERAHGH